MKTSSKILIGLLATIFMVMAAMAIDLRLFGLHGDERYTKNYTEDFPVEQFSHVMLENTGSFEIAVADKNYIHFQTISDTLKSTIRYSITGDTLKITGNQPTHFSNYTLYSNSKIESISIRGGAIFLSSMNQDSILVDLVNGEWNSFGSDSTKTSFLKHVRINQVNSSVSLENIKIDTLDVNMQNSQSWIGVEINHVNASLRSESELSLKDAENLNLVKDKSSRINFW